ncbi:hypothetical protein, partial [Burkholderia sp. LMG 13014]|uniref:hypothetical protein n=1 Tax=Burkholderia sp. LMG 13014 TaxID=2709306 RepID=UPI0019643689
RRAGRRERAARRAANAAPRTCIRSHIRTATPLSFVWVRIGALRLVATLATRGLLMHRPEQPHPLELDVLFQSHWIDHASPQPDIQSMPIKLDRFERTRDRWS